MRKTLIEQLIKTDHKNRYFLTADVGYGVLEPLRDKMGDRFINVGICEPTMISVAAGLALSGKEVFTYTMCSFYTKCLEVIKLDLCVMNLPVTLIGVGVDFDYEQHGVTHFGLEDKKMMRCLLNIDVYTPKTKNELIEIVNKKAERPRYIRVSRFDRDRRFKYKLNKYPTEGGSLEYYEKKFGKDEKMH